LLFFDRLDRSWKQKFTILNEIHNINDRDDTANLLNNPQLKNKPQVDIEFRFDELQSNYLVKIDQLENLTQSLRKIIKEFEQRYDEKQKEFEDFKAQSEFTINLLKTDLDNASNILKEKNQVEQPVTTKTKKIVKIYEPNEFQDSSFSIAREIQLDEYNKCLSELKKVKTELANLSNQLKLKDQEQETNLNKLIKSYETKLTNLNAKHKYEIEKLLNVFTGSSIGNESKNLSSEFDIDSPLNDPIQMRLLLNARDRHQEMRKTIEKQQELLASVYKECKELHLYKEKCESFDELNMKLLNQIEKLKLELDELKSIMDKPQLKVYENLKQKIQNIEKNFLKREKELHDLISSSANGIETEASFSDSRSFLLDSKNRGGDDIRLQELKKFYEYQLDLKNNEIKKFRLEFDAILQLLYSL
jgi:hypothetical protein